MASEIIAYCRAGFEADTAEELISLASEQGIYGYPQFVAGQGYVLINLYEDTGSAALLAQLPVNTTVFARQLVQGVDVIEFVDKTNRVAEVALALMQREIRSLGNLWVEFPDTDAGKQLAKFCRKFAVPLRKALRTEGLLSEKETPTLPCLHLFFTDFDRCRVGLSLPHQHAPFENGLCRLKFPVAAPSRSTLKLEEALVSMVNTSEAQVLCPSGATAVDLGACPGGWTYQLVKRGMRVEAVDNGAIDPALMDTGLVTHYRADGFTFQPKAGRVHLLVCDMIEQPLRVAKLMGEWLRKGWTQHAVFNLKLPMKKRFSCVQEALQLLHMQLEQTDKAFSVRCRHLYHNRDEVTVVVMAHKR